MAVDPLALKITLGATIALTAKFFATTCIQGGTRFKTGTRPPEDSKLSLAQTMGKGVTQNYGLGSGTSSSIAEKYRLEEARWLRIVQNDLENLPLGLVAAWVGVLCTAM
eukprot:RCo033916